MAALIGGVVGAAVAVFLLAWLIDRLAFRGRGIATRALVPTGVAFALAVLVNGFARSSTGAWEMGDGPLIYGAGAVIAGGLRFLQLTGREERTR